MSVEPPTPRSPPTAVPRAAKPEGAPSSRDLSELDTPECRADLICASNLARCKTKDAEGCAAVASVYAHGLFGLTKDLARAAWLYELACDLDARHGCFEHGAMLRDGGGVPKNLGRAVDRLQRSCDAGRSAFACQSLVAMGHAEWAGPRLLALCDASDMLACANLATSYAAQKDHAVGRLKEMCRGGDAASCGLIKAMARIDPAFR